MDSKTEQVYISFVTDVTFLASSTDWNSDIASLFNQLFTVCNSKDATRWEMDDLVDQICSLNPRLEFVSLTDQMIYLMTDEELDTEWKIILSLITQIIFLVSSMNLDSESKLVSPIKQMISFFKSKPDSELELISLITQTMHHGFSVDSDLESTQESQLLLLISQVVSLKLEPELTSLIRQTIYHFRSMNWEPLQLISVCPQAEVDLIQGKFRVLSEDVQPNKTEKGECYPRSIQFSRSATGRNLFHCLDCNGKNHEEYDKVLVEVRHPLHPKHSLQLVRLLTYGDMRQCYCCDEVIKEMFYYCSACDFAMTLDCVKKPLPALSIDVPKWHEHSLALFPSQASLTCTLCALTQPSCPFYICPPCDFVVHQKCLTLPKVIKISRHPQHRISFIPSFDKGDRCCRVCQRKINNDYGGYSCVKDGCSYAAHSKCATQTNVWDGIELEGVPEEIEEEVLAPFVRISDGIIQHFFHQQHHLKFDENADRDYDENKLCQACITPIYFGNFYSCMECDFVIHEKCANISRRIYHPTHPHRLSLEVGFEGTQEEFHFCSTCDLRCIGGMFYKCAEEECLGFKMHVQCATTSEPFINEIHMHPLFLTSKPDEKRKCTVCKRYRETFNCIEDECDFSLCFGCATIPQRVRYKHDKHILTLSYGEETSTTSYWCEVCEGNVNPKKRFYKCNEYCCVTIHIKCLIGKDLYMKPGSSWFFNDSEVGVVANNQMTRPFCSHCTKRCPYKIVFQRSGLIFCSIRCMW